MMECYHKFILYYPLLKMILLQLFAKLEELLGKFGYICEKKKEES